MCPFLVEIVMRTVGIGHDQVHCVDPVLSLITTRNDKSYLLGCAVGFYTFVYGTIPPAFFILYVDNTGIGTVGNRVYDLYAGVDFGHCLVKIYIHQCVVMHHIGSIFRYV